MNRITKLFGIKYPIIQAGMVWCSGWRLASAVSNSGGLGIIGAGSMHIETLEEHIEKCHSKFVLNSQRKQPIRNRITSLFLQLIARCFTV